MTSKFETFKVPQDEIFWKEEPWDAYIPKGGFIEDFVTALRGVATPSSLCLWSAIGIISAMLKRDTWLGWYPKPLLPNLYILLVAPPKMCAKSTGILFGLDVAREVPEYFKHIGDIGSALKKQIRTSSSRATPEGIITKLQPEEFTWEEHGIIKTGSTGSQLAFMISELSTFLTKTQYNIGLISKLTDLYDGKATDDDLTATHKQRYLKDIYVTLMAGTTPDDLKDVIPEEAFGGGFMSRCIIVMEKKPIREYPMPRGVINNAEKRLAERLAWILKKSQGEFTLTKEAREYYNKWYKKWIRHVSEINSTKIRDLLLRSDTNLLKLALILTVQTYYETNTITLETLMQAETLLDRTIESSIVALNEIGASFYHSKLETIKTMIQRKGKYARRTLLQNCSGQQVNAELLTKLLEQLVQEDKIKVLRDGREHQSVTTASNELYVWIGG